MRCVIGCTDARESKTEQERCAEHQKNNDRDHLDHREPELNGAEVVDAQRVEVDHRHRKCCNPEKYGRVREPVLAVDRGGNNFGFQQR